MICTFTREGEYLVCSTCGARIKTKLDRLKRNCGKPPIRGLGDVIERITTATGIKGAVEAVSGGDCGCKKRRDKLNEWFPL